MAFQLLFGHFGGHGQDDDSEDDEFEGPLPRLTRATMRPVQYRRLLHMSRSSFRLLYDRDRLFEDKLTCLRVDYTCVLDVHF
jgi:hypothetical protein